MGKMSYITLLGILLCIVVAASGCAQIPGTGNQTPDISGVTNVALNGPGTLIIQQGNNESIKIEADDNLMSKISTTVSGNSLSISNLNSISNRAVKIYITLKDLNSLTTNGGGDSEVTDLNTDSLSVTLDNGKMTLSGDIDNLIATINGDGTITAKDLISQKATITINGEGKATLNIVNTLNAVVNGGGSIKYSGNPQVKQQVNGLGSITKE